jgi:hypothetical protein
MIWDNRPAAILTIKTVQPLLVWSENVTKLDMCNAVQAAEFPNAFFADENLTLCLIRYTPYQRMFCLNL